MFLLGIDVGGTSVKLALVNDDGSAGIAARSSLPFEMQSAEEMCAQIRTCTEDMLRGIGCTMEDIAGAGACVPGNLDESCSTVINAFNLGFHDVPLKKLLSEQFPGKEIALMNDADAAALAEHEAGSLMGCRNAILITLGTGIGAGLILDGRLFRGGNGRGFELGHVPFRSGGDVCTCGLDGCLERYVSASSLARRGREVLGDRITDAKAVTDAVRDGDPIACKLFSEYIEDLSSALAGVCNAFDPERIAIGGGLSAAGELLFAPLMDLVEKKNFFRARYEIVPARFLNDAGVLGAAFSAGLTKA